MAQAATIPTTDSRPVAIPSRLIPSINQIDVTRAALMGGMMLVRPPKLRGGRADAQDIEAVRDHIGGIHKLCVDYYDALLRELNSMLNDHVAREDFIGAMNDAMSELEGGMDQVADREREDNAQFGVGA